MGVAESLISGDELKAATLRFSGEMRTRIEHEQGGLPSVFDSWFIRVVKKLIEFDPRSSWEESVAKDAQHCAGGGSLHWDLMRLRLFLDRWRQGRFVDYRQRERSQGHYHPRFGTEFGADVLLTCQGAPSLMRWRGLPLMKNVFDFAIYPALIAELRPRTIFEIGSGSGASAIWFADNLELCGIQGHVNSVDLKQAKVEHPRVSFLRGDCADPASLFDPALLRSAPHPFLVVEDAHQNVLGVLEHMHQFMSAGDYLVVEDSDVKREAIRSFLAPRAGSYVVDTKFTDNFGRNATCAGDAIFVRTDRPA
jgi:cephalosporin hydroxylase